MGKSVKKILTIFFAGVMVLSLVACGAKTAESTEAVEKAGDTVSAEKEADEKSNDVVASGDRKKLTMWLPPRGSGAIDEQAYWEELLIPWEEENNCDVEISIIPWASYEEKYLAGFSAESGPDVGYMYNEMLYDYIDLGEIEPLDDYLTAEDKENYLHLNLGQVDGKQMTMPTFIGEPRILAANMEILGQAGITELPTTWDEFVGDCLAVKEKCPDVVPYINEWGSEGIGLLNNAYFPFMWQAGGDLMKYDGTCTLMDNNGAVEAAQFVYDLMYKYEVLPKDCIALTESLDYAEFKEGGAAFCIMNINLMEDCRANGGNFEIIGGLGKTDPQNWHTWDGADSLILNASSNDKELGWSLIKFITSKDSMEDIHQNLCNGATLTKDEKSYLSDEMNALYQEPNHLHPLPIAKNSNAVETHLKNNLQLMLMGDMTPEEAIQDTVDFSKTLD